MPLVSLTRDPLQVLNVEAVGYGAKDTGEMGGGAAAAILTAAGPEIVPVLKLQLAGLPRRVGDVALTDSFQLRGSGIKWIIHIISIIKHTPQGAWCPQPTRLADGVSAALTAAADAGARSVAFSALGTGEGRVDPRDAARHMFQGVQAFRQKPGAPELRILFSLPSYRDFEVFQSVLSMNPTL